jgi:MraZ protein
MAAEQPLILGEFRRTLDERYRLSIPGELLAAMTASAMTGSGGAPPECILAKERPGALSLWASAVWEERLSSSIHLVQAKIQAGRLSGRVEDVQHLGRLLSTRHKAVQLAGRGRLVIPEGFREFLQVPTGGEVLLIGAALCVEIWRPEAWLQYLNERMPEFGTLLNDLSS